MSDSNQSNQYAEAVRQYRLGMITPDKLLILANTFRADCGMQPANSIEELPELQRCKSDEPVPARQPQQTVRVTRSEHCTEDIPNASTLQPLVDTDINKRVELTTDYMIADLMQTMQYLQYISQRVDQLAQIYLTVLTGAIALAAAALSVQTLSLLIVTGIFSAGLLTIGIAGITMSLRIMAMRALRRQQRNRAFEMQRYFADMTPDIFTKYNFRLRPSVERKRHIWNYPFMALFGLAHCILLSIGTSLAFLLVTYSLGVPLNTSGMWMILLGTITVVIAITIYSILFNHFNSSQ